MKKGKFTSFIKPIILLICLIIFVFVLLNIYSSIYKILNDTNYAYFFNNTLFLVNNDNYSPDYKKNDYLLLNKKKYYFEGDRVVYESNNSYRISRVINYSSGTYTIVDKNNNYSRIDDTMIIGKIKVNLHKSGILVSSPL